MTDPKSKPESKKERRRFSRVERRAAITIESDGKSFQGTILNFSEVGLLVLAPESFPPGSSVRIPMNLSSGKNHKVEGAVRWVRPYKDPQAHFAMGIELAAVPEEYLKAVSNMRKFVSENSNRGPEERFDVYHKVAFKTGGNFLSEYTENISRGGMYLATDQILEVGSVIQAELTIPGESVPIQVDGKVTYRLDQAQAKERGRTPGVGIQFVNLTDHVRKTLNHYIQRLTIHRSSIHRRSSEHLPRSGSLNDFLVPEILVSLAEQNATGVLSVEREEVRKKIYFQKGSVVFVESPLQSETLEHYFSYRGLIPLEQIGEWLSLWHEADVVFAQRIIDAHIIERDKVLSALIKCHEERLTRTFFWFDGKFSFMDGTDWGSTITILPLQIHRMIFEGINQWFDAAVVEAWMGLDERALVKSKIPSLTTELPAEAYPIIHSCWGQKSLLEISEEVSIPLQKLIPSVYALVISGWLELQFSPDKTQGDSKTLPPPKTLDPAVEKMVQEDLEKLGQLNYFDLLGATEKSSEREISKLYEVTVKKYSNANLGSEKVTQLLSWLRAAKETLTHPSMRAMYIKDRETQKLEGDRRSYMEDHELLLAMSEVKDRKFSAALARLTTFVKNSSTNAAVLGWYAWCLYQEKGGTVLKEALETLERAIHMDPSDPHLHFFSGQIFVDQKEWKKAELAFFQAIRLQANFLDAQNGLKLVRAQI